MIKFSVRVGVTSPPKELQCEVMNDELRNSIWNIIALAVSEDGDWKRVLRFLFINFYKKAIDTLPYADWECRKWFFENFLKLEWNRVYELTEMFTNNISKLTGERITPSEFEKHLNEMLKRELAGYRSIDCLFVPITNQSELDEIKTSLSQVDKYAGVRLHISNALSLLGQKPIPDYRNSIKESISAVESVTKIESGHLTSKNIEKPLATIVEHLDLHPSLKKAFSHLYNYTSDEDGIRHAILEQKEIGFAEAKYMLISCSAFVNFLISKANK